MSTDVTEDDDDWVEPLRPFKIDLFIIHPSLDPQIIGAALGLDGHHAHPVGAERRAPNGTLTGGRYPDTRWRHCAWFELPSQHYTKALSHFLSALKPHRDFLHQIRTTGGAAHLILHFLGHHYFGDTITRDTLKALIDLELDLGTEVFAVPQNSQSKHMHRHVDLKSS